MPTDAYALDEAVAGRLPGAAERGLGAAQVPARGHPLRRPVRGGKGRSGTRWNGTRTAPSPTRVEAEAVNKWLFNDDTVDKVLAHLMTHGPRSPAATGSARRSSSPRTRPTPSSSQQRFDANYPQLRRALRPGHHSRDATYAQTLIDDFSTKDKAPHIAISVDMLDTGIDVPEVVNLVFFKLVRSKTKFWQMIGRGTRLCPDLFGPGEDKEYFYVFDFCQNLEFFSQIQTRTRSQRCQVAVRAAVRCPARPCARARREDEARCRIGVRRGPRAPTTRGVGRAVARRGRRSALDALNALQERVAGDEPRQLHRPHQAPRGREISACRCLGNASDEDAATSWSTRSRRCRRSQAPRARRPSVSIF